MSKYTIGIDYGTDSVRALLVDAFTGQEISTSVFEYPRWKEGKYCNPALNQFRQHPLDYTEGLEFVVKKVLEGLPSNINCNIVGISIDTTGSTPVAVNTRGTPLALTKGFEENPNAMFILWKDHTAIKEADEITDLTKSWSGVDYTKYVGGTYSSEWFWAKILHILRQDNRVREKSYSWVEHCDWVPALLVGNTNPLALKRSRCAAGHKAMWNSEFGGLPSEEFLVKLDPLLQGLRNRLYTDTYTIESKVGTLSSEWTEKLGLSENVIVGSGALDAHVGAIGAEVKPYHFCKVMGTSTCDMLVAHKKTIKNKLLKGISGQVDGSILPGLIGLEAGQSAFGDIYVWFKELILWPLKSSGIAKDKYEQLSSSIIENLSKAASKINPEDSSELALDWLNGRRSPDANQKLKGAIMGLSLSSDAPSIFRALVESTAFGAKSIIERFINEGIRIDAIIALGGVAKKSDFVMQVVADVLNKPIRIIKSEQTVALGAAMAAAVVAGIYKKIEDAQDAMGSGVEKEYQPVSENVVFYEKKYDNYLEFGNALENLFYTKDA